jgi:hypothetical protein
MTWQQVVYGALCLKVNDDEQQARHWEVRQVYLPPVDLRAVCLVRAIWEYKNVSYGRTMSNLAKGGKLKRDS